MFLTIGIFPILAQAFIYDTYLLGFPFCRDPILQKAHKMGTREILAKWGRLSLTSRLASDSLLMLPTFGAVEKLYYQKR
jgi:hypothetical protein